MISLSGKGVSDGIGKGPLHYVKLNTEEKYSANVQEEKDRVNIAIEETLYQLKEITEIYSNNETISQVLKVHTMLTEDVSFLSRIDSILSEEECNAEYAVFKASKQISDELVNLPDDYISERGTDVRDVADRIISNLSEEKNLLELMESRVIIVADELLPSHILRLDKEKTAGVIFKRGSKNSHSAILLRSLGIPAVFNVSNMPSEYYEGIIAYIDGNNGTVEILPDEETEKEYTDRELLYSKPSEYWGARSQRDTSSDGKILNILCNINLLKDVHLINEYNVSGIGLFRTEFLFLMNDTLPTEIQQYEVYKNLLLSVNNKKVVIRTLDIGEDKSSVLLHNINVDGSKNNDNGIRFCLNRPEIFKTQLRAIYKASRHGNVSILIPGVMTKEEVIATKNICNEVIDELSNEGHIVSKVPLGVMIETKEALQNANELAKLVDFFSVGTNDLSVALSENAYSRNNTDDANVDIERVLTAIELISSIAKENGIHTSVCGELASDENYLQFFIDNEIDEISVSLSKVLKLRYFLNNI